MQSPGEHSWGETLTNDTGRFVIIGDAHGCYRECADMLELLKVTSDDTVIFAGDMIDRGEDSGLTLDLSMKHNAIMGNHERHHIRYQTKIQNGDLDERAVPHYHSITRDQMRPAHHRYIANLPSFIRLPQYNSVVVHAGAFPDRPIEEQTMRHLMNIQCIDPTIDDETYWPSRRPVNSSDNHLGERPGTTYEFWTKFWKGPERLIFGHSVLSSPLVTEFAVGIDGGCCHGHELWAWVLPEGKVYRVPSRQGGGDSWTGFEIHEGIRTY